LIQRWPTIEVPATPDAIEATDMLTGRAGRGSRAMDIVAAAVMRASIVVVPLYTTRAVDMAVLCLC
jgi:hypothetical protein